MNGIPGNLKCESAPIVSLPIGIEKSAETTLKRVRRIRRESYHRHKLKAVEYRKKRRAEIHQFILAQAAEWRKNNKEKIAAYHRKWAKSHPEKASEGPKRWVQANREKAKATIDRWEKANPDKVKVMQRRHYLKRQADPRTKLNLRLCTAIRGSLSKGSKRKRHWEDLVGYSVEQLMKHLEKRFTPEMSWNNYGSYWNIDHKIPISVFNFSTPEDSDFKRCWALKNLQPLQAGENFRKHNKLTGPFQPSLL